MHHHLLPVYLIMGISLSLGKYSGSFHLFPTSENFFGAMEILFFRSLSGVSLAVIIV